MLVIKKLTAQDINMVLSFIRGQLKTIPEGFFFPPSLTITKRALNNNNGISCGAFDDSNLIGVRLTYIPGLDKENHGYDLGYSVEQLKQVAQFHGTLVLNEKRYNGIGNEIVSQNCETIFQKGLSRILATVHPENLNSIKMLEKNGFIKKAEVLKYDNLPRIIFEKCKA